MTTTHPGASDHARMTTLFFSELEGAETALLEEVADLIDEMLQCYAEWGESASGVTDAYSRWCGSRTAEGAQRFSAYISALDQEEAAATTYAGAVADIERWCPHGPRESIKGAPPREAF
jgi:hypothetical protein